jgi:hypothetical protein
MALAVFRSRDDDDGMHDESARTLAMVRAGDAEWGESERKALETRRSFREHHSREVQPVRANSTPPSSGGTPRAREKPETVARREELRDLAARMVLGRAERRSTPCRKRNDGEMAKPANRPYVPTAS